LHPALLVFFCFHRFMQVKLTIGERLKDLRTAQKLTLEQLAAEVGISKSALGKYESDNGKDISPYSILLPADYYGVSCDYLMGRTETKNHPNTALHELHLSDASIDVLKTGKFNQRLLSELICHKDFQRFMLDAEIYIDRIADMRVKDMNAVLEAVRQMAFMKRYNTLDFPTENRVPTGMLRAPIGNPVQKGIFPLQSLIFFAGAYANCKSNSLKIKKCCNLRHIIGRKLQRFITLNVNKKWAAISTALI
jgi:transcriptional regulator with XRE-family HTH domain